MLQSPRYCTQDMLLFLCLHNYTHGINTLFPLQEALLFDAWVQFYLSCHPCLLAFGIDDGLINCFMSLIEFVCILVSFKAVKWFLTFFYMRPSSLIQILSLT